MLILSTLIWGLVNEIHCHTSCMIQRRIFVGDCNGKFASTRGSSNKRVNSRCKLFKVHFESRHCLQSLSQNEFTTLARMSFSGTAELHKDGDKRIIGIKSLKGNKWIKKVNGWQSALWEKGFGVQSLNFHVSELGRERRFRKRFGFQNFGTFSQNWIKRIGGSFCSLERVEILYLILSTRFFFSDTSY